MNFFLCVAIGFLLLVLSFCNGCPEGWENFQDKKCIKYFPVNRNYQQAVELCTSEQSSLVTIYSYDEQDFVETMAKRHSRMSGVHWAWIGATRPHESTPEFVWSNGKSMNFTRWRNGCPDSRQGENCVLMTVFRDRPSHWCNFKCDTNHDHVICEKPFTGKSDPKSPKVTTVNPVTESSTPCPFGWEQFEEKCFKFHNANVTGDQARHICKFEHNASMVSIHSEAEQAFLVEYLFFENGASEAVWIGLKRKADNASEFYWVNNKPFDYKNWGFNEPDNRYIAGPENCVIVNDVKPNYGRWVDVPCHLEFLLVCEKNANVDHSSSERLSTESNVIVPSSTIESGNNAQQSKLESHSSASNVCSHGVWLAILSISVVLLFTSLAVLFHFYRKKVNNNLYASTIDFANVQYDGRAVNEYNQEGTLSETSHYSEITYSPNFGCKLPTRSK